MPCSLHTRNHLIKNVFVAISVAYTAVSHAFPHAPEPDIVQIKRCNYREDYPPAIKFESGQFISCDAEYNENYLVSLLQSLVPSKLIDFVQKKIVAMFGIPCVITADRGSTFVAHSFRDWCQRLNIHLNLVPAYQPEWNGIVERANRSIRYSLTKIRSPNWSSWHSVLPNVLFGMRAAVSAATGYSPYFLVFGKDPCVPPVSIDPASIHLIL